MTVSTGYATWFTEDAREFLDRAGEHLAQRPLTATVVSTVAQRAAAGQARGDRTKHTPYDWFAVVTDDSGEVVGTAMRTAPFAPYPPYLLAMPDGAAVAIASALLDRGEEVGGAAGELPAAEVFAAQVARTTGREVRRDLHMRLFRLGELVEPPRPPGRLRRPRPDETRLALEWYQVFHLEADEQAGRDTGGHGARGEGWTLDQMTDRIANGLVWFWADEDDRPVHVTGANPPAYGVARIGPVYTPKEHRGRGYASAAVAAVSRELLEQAEIVALFTDQANPTSNHIYPALGYVPVTDTVELLIEDPP